MIKHYFLTFVLFSFSISLIAQEIQNAENTSVTYPREKYILSLALLSQLDINSPSLQVGLDIKVNEWFGVHQELGFVNNWLNPFYTFWDNFASSKPKLKNGLIYIVEPRFYPLSKDRLFGSRFFISPSFNFRYVNIKRNEMVSRANGAYRQQLKFDINKLAYGGMIKVGFTTKLAKARPIQMVFGIGARYSQRFTNLPDNVSNENDINIIFPISKPKYRGNQWHPDAYLGMLLQLHYFTKK